MGVTGRLKRARGSGRVLSLSVWRRRRQRAARALARVADPATALVKAEGRARAYQKQNRAEETKRAYRRAWGAWATWCQAHGVAPLPAAPAHLGAFLAELSDAGAALSTIAQTLSAVNRAHELAGHPGPRQHRDVRETWEGIRRARRGEKKRQARPLSPEQLRRIVLAGEGLAGVRDRALLLLGFAGAFRRSELVALDVADLERNDDGLMVMVHSSKTDQVGAGARVGVPYGSDRVTCPVRAVEDWLGVAAITTGAVFRSVHRSGRVSDRRLSDRDVARVVRRAAKRAGVDVERLSGHSLRAGLATTAAKAGKRMDSIMRQGRWKTVGIVQQYIRDATALGDDNAAGGIGL